MNMTISRARTKVLAVAFPVLFRVDERKTGLMRLGTDYGGWWVPGDVLGPESVCYSAGVGTDISFDLALIERFQCSVFGIDPTPKSLQWVSELKDLPSSFRMIPVGLGGRVGFEKFYAPSDASHVSHSVKNIQRTDSFFEARVQTVSALMNDLGHDRVDLLKLDIEGAEHDTIDQLLKDGLRPTIICVEYDQPEPLTWAFATTSKLREAGYKLLKVDLFNLTFFCPRQD